MTAITITGVVTDQLGFAVHRTIGWDGQTATEHRHYSAVPAADFRTIQADRIDINLAHDRRAVGEVLHLERGPAGDLLAVAVVERQPWLLSTQTGPLFWSGEIRCTHDYQDVELTGLAITDKPAVQCLPPLQIHAGDVRSAAWRSSWTNLTVRRDLLERAVTTMEQRRRGDPIRITEQVRHPSTYLGDGNYLDHRGELVGRSIEGPLIRLPDGSRAPMRYGTPSPVLNVR